MSDLVFQIPLTGRKLPPGWQERVSGVDGSAWYNSKRKLAVIGSISVEADGKPWLHLSLSHPKRMPTYDDLVYLKKHWAGEDRKCIMVMPPKSEHVNIHPFCLHLWCCLGEDPLPDFSGEICGVRTI